MSKFYVAALTGRSGSGKSYASEYLAKRGIPTIDSDVVAREVVGVGSRCLKELVRCFGADILQQDGSLNRKLLGDLCFSDQRKKDKLDEITHPRIIEKLLDDFDELRRQGHKYCLVEAAAVIESGLYAVCDRLIMITSDEKSQIDRIILRDGLTLEQAQTRLNAQVKEDELRGICDVVIENNGTLEQFNKKLDELATQLEDWFLE
ncbi:MAG: dephospho-CoA kinase [Oscillospiraceae bacterium]